MKNGIYAARVEDSSIRAVYVDQEIVEFAAQNAKVQRRMDVAATQKHKAVQKARNRKKAMDRLVNQSLKLAIAMAVVAALGWLGLINWILAVILDCFALVAVGIQMGRWAEKAAR